MSTDPTTTGQIEESLLHDAFHDDDAITAGPLGERERDLFALYLAIEEQEEQAEREEQAPTREVTPFEDETPALAMEISEEDLFEVAPQDAAPSQIEDLAARVALEISGEGYRPDFVLLGKTEEREPGATSRVHHPDPASTRPRPAPAGRGLDAGEPARHTRTYEPARPSKPADSPRVKDEVEGPLDALLRDRDALLDVIMKGKGLVSVARVMLLTVVVCGAALGASVGMYRGGVQILFASIKLPLVLLMTTAVCAPVYTALKMAMRERASLIEDFALVLSSLALASVVAASLAPLLLLAIFNEYSYHALTLLMVAICGIGGMSGFLFFTKGLRRQQVAAERMIYLVFLCVIGVVSMQVSWLMRPYLVRPQTEDVPFVRSLEGSFFEAVRISADSVRGVYSYDDDIEHRRAYDRTMRRVLEQREAATPPRTRALDVKAAAPMDRRAVIGRTDDGSIPTIRTEVANDIETAAPKEQAGEIAAPVGEDHAGANIDAEADIETAASVDADLEVNAEAEAAREVLEEVSP